MGEERPDSEAIKETKQQLRRVRKRRRLSQQRVLEGAEPNPHHDLLIVPPKEVIEKDEIYRVPVVKVSGVVNQGDTEGDDVATGSYVDQPELLDSYDYAQRRALSIARPQDWGNPNQSGIVRGPAFGTIPVKREPAATASGACYLIDAQNLTFRNSWTAEEWTSVSLDEKDNLPAARSTDDASFEVLLAGPRGKVFLLKVEIAGMPWVPDEPIAIEITTGENGKTRVGEICCLDLRHEVEIWNQLRNGLVAGRVYRRAGGGKTFTPIVNITTLVPDDTNLNHGDR